MGLADRVENPVRAGVVAGARHPLPVADVVGEVGVHQQLLEVRSALSPVDPQGLGEKRGDDQAGPIVDAQFDARCVVGPIREPAGPVMPRPNSAELSQRIAPTRGFMMRTQNPRVLSFQKVPICRYFMPEEGLEPTAFGL